MNVFLFFSQLMPWFTIKTINQQVHFYAEMFTGLCTDCLCLNVGASRAGYETDPHAHIAMLIFGRKRKWHCCACVWFYESDYHLAHFLFIVGRHIHFRYESYPTFYIWDLWISETRDKRFSELNPAPWTCPWIMWTRLKPLALSFKSMKEGN